MKRYWSFGGNYEYPSGGMKDFKGCFDTVDEAKDAASLSDWAHVYDAQECIIVAEWRPVSSPYSRHKWYEVNKRLELW